MLLRPDQMPRAAEQVTFSSAVPILSTSQNVKSALEDLAQTLSEASNLELTEPLPEPHETAQTVQEALVSLASVGPAQSASNVAPVTQPSHGFSVGTQIRPTNSGWVRAQGNTIANATNVWTTVSVDGDDFTACKVGRVNIPSHGLGSNNTLQYLSPTSAGGFTSTKPVGTTSTPLGFFLPVIWIEDANHIHVLGKSYPEINPVLANYQPSSDVTAPTVSFPVTPSLYSNQEFTLEFQASWISNNAGSALVYGPALSIIAGTVSSTDLFSFNFQHDGAAFIKDASLGNFFRFSDTYSDRIVGEVRFRVRRESSNWMTIVEGGNSNKSTTGNFYRTSNGFVCSTASPSSVSLAFTFTTQPGVDNFRLFASNSDFVRLLWKGPN